VQAGLGLDAAIDRVGREMHLSCPQLSTEFELTGLELRAGASRADALRHLSARIGLEDVDALVVMLILAITQNAISLMSVSITVIWEIS
jgi:tight adherence protein C